MDSPISKLPPVLNVTLADQVPVVQAGVTSMATVAQLQAGLAKQTDLDAANTAIAGKVSTNALAAQGGAATVGNTPAGNIGSTTVQGALNELDTEKVAVNALAAGNGTTLVGLDATAAAVAGTLSAHFKGDVNPADIPWLCKFDGVTDDSAAFWACVTFAKSRGYKVRHPGGILRIVSGFTQATAYDNIFIYGHGRINELGAGSAASSQILLDSADAASYFLNIANHCTIRCEGLIFKCAQAVVDRPFFKFTSALYMPFFRDISFVNVERPFVFAAGSYFQNGSWRDVQFSNSGTFHSECPAAVASTSLVGTFMLLDNVNHEGSVPATNTEKIVCNLQGIRKIKGHNFVLEGSLPAAGWTVLRLNNPCSNDAYYTRTPFADIQGFWSEWSGAYPPAFIVDQVGGTVEISGELGLTTTSLYKLSSLGRVIINKTTFSATLDEVTTFFSIENNQCVVDFVGCSMRKFDPTKAGFNHHYTQDADINNGTGQIVLSNTAAQEIYRWTGGFVAADGMTQSTFTGTAAPSTDATYGRKLVFTPAAGALDARVATPTGMDLGLQVGSQVTASLKAKLPTFTGGMWAFNLWVNNNTVATKYFDTSYSGQVVDVLIPWVLISDVAPIGIAFSNGTATGVAGNVEVYSMVLYHGKAVPRLQSPRYPRNILTYWTAAPTTGTWAQGDKALNMTPAVGSPKGWTCTVAGSPGTWVSDGNL